MHLHELRFQHAMGSEIKTVVGTGIPLLGNDIDTDRIIPARFLKAITFEGLGQQAFADDRAQAQGQHSFDLPQYQQAKILVVNDNFGCGSSREHAPQAIARWGISAIVGESFAEIFFGNCVAIGIPCVTASVETVQALQQHIQNHPQEMLTVDLETLQLRSSVLTAPLYMEEGPRQMLLSGTWDACGQLLSNLETIRQTAAQLPYLRWSHAVG